MIDANGLSWLHLISPLSSEPHSQDPFSLFLNQGGQSSSELSSETTVEQVRLTRDHKVTSVMIIVLFLFSCHTVQSAADASISHLLSMHCGGVNAFGRTPKKSISQTFAVSTVDEFWRIRYHVWNLSIIWPQHRCLPPLLVHVWNGVLKCRIVREVRFHKSNGKFAMLIVTLTTVY